jgi:hypothetical protein
MITLLPVIRKKNVGQIKTVYLRDKFSNNPTRNIGLIVIIVLIHLRRFYVVYRLVVGVRIVYTRNCVKRRNANTVMLNLLPVI